MTQSVILTGFMATGKSVVSRVLARRLGWRHFDCDAEIVARAGRPIAEIFRLDGEARFRALEREVIDSLADDPTRCRCCGERPPVVVATGGGALVDPHNCAQLSRLGLVIGLTARPEIIARRVGASAKSRPMLTEGGKPLIERINELIELRREAYSRAAVTVDTSEMTIDKVVETIVAKLAPSRCEACRHFA